MTPRLFAPEQRTIKINPCHNSPTIFTNYSDQQKASSPATIPSGADISFPGRIQALGLRA